MTGPNTIVDRDGRTHRFPPPLEHDYRLVDGRLQTRSLEAHVVDHCNLTCAECCSLSPLLPARTTAADVLARDLALAGRVLAPRTFKLVGGEPLLHPDLVTLLHVARDSEIAPTISLTTNGLRLLAMPDAMWEAVDAITISRYPRPALSAATVAEIEARARRFEVPLNWKQQDRFVKMSRSGPPDPAQTERTYARCWLRERCHLVRDGRFYTCTRPVHFARLAGHDDDPHGDGHPLHDTTAEAVLAYLRRERPLATCARCAGGDAPSAPHRLLSRDELTGLRRRSEPDRADEGSPPEPG